MREISIWAFPFVQIEEEIPEECLGSSCKVFYPNLAATLLQPNFVGTYRSHSHIIFVDMLFPTDLRSGIPPLWAQRRQKIA